jgi:hypothetical protein
MKVTPIQMVILLLIGVAIGIVINGFIPPPKKEGFESSTMCGSCKKVSPCGCSNPLPRAVCPPCREPDMSKYVLKATVPACPTCPDLDRYILKSEVPPVPDLSNSVLKSSIPKPQPVILDCSKCNKPKGECPPCPRPRCPEVKCPPPTQCAACAPCPRQECPPSVVKCKAEPPEGSDGVRPFLAPLNYFGFGRD